MSPETDLASRWLGGSVIAASDESFGEKENLLTPAPAAFEPGHYGPRGEIVDGWETGRRRSPGHDWAMIRRVYAPGPPSARGAPARLPARRTPRASLVVPNHPRPCRRPHITAQ